MGGEDPCQRLVALVIGQLGGGGVAVGEEHQPVILLVLVIEVDGRLEIGAAASDDADTVGRLLEGYGLLGGDFAVKLNDFDAFDALLEEAVDDGEELLDVLVGDTAADIDGDQQTSAVGILAQP